MVAAAIRGWLVLWKLEGLRWVVGYRLCGAVSDSSNDSNSIGLISYVYVGPFYCDFPTNLCSDATISELSCPECSIYT